MCHVHTLYEKFLGNSKPKEQGKKLRKVLPTVHSNTTSNVTLKAESRIAPEAGGSSLDNSTAITNTTASSNLTTTTTTASPGQANTTSGVQEKQLVVPGPGEVPRNRTSDKDLLSRSRG